MVGVALRTRFPRRIRPSEPALSTTASLAYLALVLAVVGPNAEMILAAPASVARVAAAGLPPEVALPAVVYAVVQMLTSPLVARRLARST